MGTDLSVSAHFYITVVPIARTINRDLLFLTNTFHRNLATWFSIRKERSWKEKFLWGVYKSRRIRMRMDKGKYHLRLGTQDFKNILLR